MSDKREVILEVGREREPLHYWFYTWCVFSMLVVSTIGMSVTVIVLALMGKPLTNPLLYALAGLFVLAVLLTKSKKQDIRLKFRLDDFRPFLPFGKGMKEQLRKERELMDENEREREELLEERK